MIESSYTKLFSSIVTSTIWREDDKTRIVWITMLAIKNRHGQVAGSLPGLAAMANVSIPDCQSAIDKLAGPDPYSRSKEFEGRRIEAVEGGWQIINHAKYREAMSIDERRAYQAEWQKKYRARKKIQSVDQSVDRVESTLTHAEAYADTEANAGVPLIKGFEKWCKGLDRMLPSQWTALRSVLQGRLRGARSPEAKSEWNRRIAAVDERLVGPPVIEPMAVAQAPTLQTVPCPESDWKMGMDEMKAAVAAATPARTVKRTIKEQRQKLPAP